MYTFNFLKIKDYFFWNLYLKIWKVFFSKLFLVGLNEGSTTWGEEVDPILLTAVKNFRQYEMSQPSN